MLALSWETVKKAGEVYRCEDLTHILRRTSFIALREGGSLENWVYWDNEREQLMKHTGGYTQKNAVFKPGSRELEAKWYVISAL